MPSKSAWARVSIGALLAGALAIGTWAPPARADEPAKEKDAPAKKETKAKPEKPVVKSDAEQVKAAVKAFKNEDPENREFIQAAMGFASRLTTNPARPAPAAKDQDEKAQAEAKAKAEADAKKLAKEILKAKKEFTTDKAFLKQLDAVAKKDAPVAARWLMQYARAYKMAAGVKDVPVHIVAGQVATEDGKLDPVFILCQMQVLDGGYFAGEIGDLKKPLSFRAHGYGKLDVSLEGKDTPVIYLGTIKLKPVSEKEQATLKGKITADGKPDMTKVTVTLSQSVPGMNTPGRNYYMPRPRWPEPVKATVNEDGEFTVTGLSPDQYSLAIAAEGFSNFSKPVTFKEGETQDIGEVHLKSTDIGFYVDAKAPEAKEFEWEKDYEAALAKAEKDKKPVMVMMTATWCGWCKVLESKVFTDPWIQKFMSPFVVVKAFEDKKLMEKWGVSGFPTLVFTDSKGEMKYKSVGYKPTMEFAAEVAKALKALDLEYCPEMKKLIDKKVIEVD